MSDRRPYSRIYWSVMEDAKFDGIRENARHFGAWALLLIVADMAHPAPAFVPASVPRTSFRALVACGLVDELTGGRFRVHGLKTERETRAGASRVGAAARWQSEQDANGMRTHSERNANGMPSKAEQSKAEQSRPSASERMNAVDRDPHLREYRDALVATHGRGLDEPTVEPLPVRRTR